MYKDPKYEFTKKIKIKSNGKHAHMRMNIKNKMMIFI